MMLSLCGELGIRGGSKVCHFPFYYLQLEGIARAQTKKKVLKDMLLSEEIIFGAAESVCKNWADRRDLKQPVSDALRLEFTPMDRSFYMLAGRMMSSRNRTSPRVDVDKK